ncbi:DUF7575 domain-containing protein [Haloparvum sp. PAK95]|uniref:DUF7575 domain-containing protein n=1 Tax=Haloparvum sp. PAK95 TaxID=3418962 RepID=UPI003D2EA4F3
MAHRFRPWIAAVLALVLAGLGHAYLRRWARALLWLVTIAASSVLLHSLHGVEPANPLTSPGAIPTDILVPLTFLIGLSAVDAFLIGREQAASGERDAAEHVAAERGVGSDSADVEGGREPGSNLDLGGNVTEILPTEGREGNAKLADEGDVKRSGTVQCPNCGKQADASLDFCHWCTERFPWADEE